MLIRWRGRCLNADQMRAACSALAFLILTGCGSIAKAAPADGSAAEPGPCEPNQAQDWAPLILHQQHISSAGIAGGDCFGWSIAISGDTALVGA